MRATIAIAAAAATDLRRRFGRISIALLFAWLAVVALCLRGQTGSSAEAWVLCTASVAGLIPLVSAVPAAWGFQAWKSRGPLTLGSSGQGRLSPMVGFGLGNALWIAPIPWALVVPADLLLLSTTEQHGRVGALAVMSAASTGLTLAMSWIGVAAGALVPRSRWAFAVAGAMVASSAMAVWGAVVFTRDRGMSEDAMGLSGLLTFIAMSLLWLVAASRSKV